MVASWECCCVDAGHIGRLVQDCDIGLAENADDRAQEELLLKLRQKRGSFDPEHVNSACSYVQRRKTFANNCNFPLQEGLT